MSEETGPSPGPSPAGEGEARRPGVLERIDAFQQRRAWLAFPYAVFQKFSDDRAGNLAALIAYYAFFSIFPLLLVLVTILGFVLAGNPGLDHEVFSSVAGQFPIIGQNSPARPLTGSPLALVIGLLLAIWSGLGAGITAQTAFDTVYGIPPAQWPGFPMRVLRSAELVVVGGGGLIITTLLQGAVSGSGIYGLHLGIAGEVIGAVVGIALNAALFTYLFRRATNHPTGWREVVVGAAVAAVAWYVLQKVGTELVNHEVAGAQGTYGTFAVVIGLLFWFYLLAQITLYCVEINIVRSRRLWPRGLPSLIEARSTTAADRAAVESYPQRERLAQNMHVDAHVTTEEEQAPARDDRE